MAAIAAATPRNPPVAVRPAAQALRNVELFGGAGGLALGLHAAGFDPLAIIEKDVSCKETLEANGKDGRTHTANWTVHDEDVATFDFSKLGEVDLLSAGAPCQPFSHGGHRKGHLDDRNLFPQVIRALHEIEPRAFVIENVRGLLFRDMELYFKGLLRELRTPRRHLAPPGRRRRGRPPDEYKVFYRVLNAADFGLPQNRHRLFIVGLLPELADRWSWPEPTHSKDTLLRALLANDYWQEHGVPRRVRESVRGEIAKATRQRLERQPPTGERWRTVRDLLSELPKPARSAKSAKDEWHLFVPDARLYAKHTGSRLDWPAKTVKAGVHGCPGGEHIVVFDDGSHRYFSVRECALLQGFPPDYAFPKARTPAMRQIGNAVPLPVAAAVGKRLVEVLNG